MKWEIVFVEADSYPWQVLLDVSMEGGFRIDPISIGCFKTSRDAIHCIRGIKKAGIKYVPYTDDEIEDEY